MRKFVGWLLISLVLGLIFASSVAAYGLLASICVWALALGFTWLLVKGIQLTTE